MAIDITIPSPGESITDVVLGPWSRTSGDWVEKDELLVEIESDKVTLEVPAPESGVLSVLAQEGAEMTVGAVIARIDPDAARPAGRPAARAEARPERAPAAEPAPRGSEPAARNEVATETASAAAPQRATTLAKKIAADKGVDLGGVRGSGAGGRIVKADVLAVSAEAPAPALAAPLRAAAPGPLAVAGMRGTRRERMSRLRQRIAERLVEAQHTAAMLTTFNEADMSEVIDLRRRHKDQFLERHGVGLGFMSFFAAACASALRAHPGLNAWIVGDEFEYHDYVDLSIAVGTPRGLVVPVIRNAERLSFAEIESAIRDLAGRAREGRLSVDEMTGGTFTISNGGVYGSLLSTPILNPPQSGILGMHKIMNRPVEDPAQPGKIALRPMMNLALSYDHRIVDGEQAVRFLVHVKECVECPERMLLGL